MNCGSSPGCGTGYPHPEAPVLLSGISGLLVHIRAFIEAYLCDMKVVHTNSQNTDFIALVRELDKYLSVKDGDAHEFYDQYNGIESLNDVVLVYNEQGEAVACGAFKPYEKNEAEIKRMYVRPAARGNGLATIVLQALEQKALEKGLQHSILETGKYMEDAVAFYKKNGYNEIPNFGQYEGIDNSICFRKDLKEFATR